MKKRSPPVLKTTRHDYEWHPKYYSVVVVLFCTLYMVTLAVGPKLIDIYGFVTSAGLIVFPLCSILSDLLTEVYGFNRTRQAIWMLLGSTVLFSLFTEIAIALPSADFWPHQEAFANVFDKTWRFTLAGCLAWVAGEFSNSYVMARMKIFQNAKHMSVRFVGSTVVGQLFDTVTVMTVAFAGTVTWGQLGLMIVTAWAFKVAYEAVALPLSVPLTNWLKRREGVEHFDQQKLHII